MSWSKNVSCGIVVSPSFQPISHEEECARSEEHTSELQSQSNLVCRLLLEKKKKTRQVQLHYNTVIRELIAMNTIKLNRKEKHNKHVYCRIETARTSQWLESANVDSAHFAR